MSKRPALMGLPFAAKPGTIVPQEPPQVERSQVVDEPVAEVRPAEPARSPNRKRGPKPSGKVDDRVTIILRVSAEERKALKAISVERDTTIQDMLHKSVTDTIRRSRNS